MTMTAIDLDDNLLFRAREILGTTTKKDTVNTALREVVRRDAADRLLETMASDVIEIRDHQALRRERHDTDR
jgi:Arc/MetJ family transcription regulator